VLRPRSDRCGPGTKSNLSERHFKIDSDRIPE
ncbi:hypothetical protein, partial [Pseudomonas aeruginosa]